MNFFNVIVRALQDSCERIGLNNIMLLFVSMLAVVIVATIILVEVSMEAKTARAIIRIEDYLQNNPFVTNENIVEFNRLMKKIPKTLRVKWQQYVVNRSNKPSKFFNEEDCIEKPFRTRGFALGITVFKYALIALVAISFIFSVCAISSTTNIVNTIVQASFVPLILVVLGIVCLVCLNARHNSLRANMYYDFNDMSKLLDRAVTTFPDFVDYEILFTKKEIDAMIPELQEYLRQRAIAEQEALEKAKMDEVEHEEYDFSSLGTDGSLVMERAMKECEFYLGNRKKTLSAIDQLQAEKDLLTKGYDEKNKTSQRKLRDINETLERLREKLNNTTNKIVGNDIRRQQADEIKKQQNIEREIEEDNNKYYEELKKIDEQINAKRNEITENRNFVEVAFANEFKAYADKVYKELKEIASKNVEDLVNSLTKENDTLKIDNEEKDKYIVERNTLFEEKVAQINENNETIKQLNETIASYEDYKSQAEEYMNGKETELSEKDKQIDSLTAQKESLEKNSAAQELRYKELKKQKVREIARCFDIVGNEFFYDDKGMPYYYQGNKKTYYYTASQIKSGEDLSGLPITREEMVVNMQESKDQTDRRLNPEDYEIEDIATEQVEDVSKQDNQEAVQEPVEETVAPQVEDNKQSANLVDDEDIVFDFEEQEDKPMTLEAPIVNADTVVEQPENVEPETTENDKKEISIKPVAKFEEVDNELVKEFPDLAEQGEDDIESIQKAIDEEVKRLNEEHGKLKMEIEDVAKVTKKTTTPKTTSKKPTTKKESASKKPATKKASTKSATSSTKKTTTKKAKEKVDASLVDFGAELSSALSKADKDSKK